MWSFMGLDAQGKGRGAEQGELGGTFELQGSGILKLASIRTVLFCCHDRE